MNHFLTPVLALIIWTFVNLGFDVLAAYSRHEPHYTQYAEIH